MQVIDVRAMTNNDLSYAWRIKRDAFGKPCDIASITQLAKGKRALSFVAAIGDKVVGYVIVTMEKPDIVINELAVHPDYQRQGVGSALLSSLQARLKLHTFNTIVGWAEFENRAAWMLATQNNFSSHFVTDERIEYRHTMPELATKNRVKKYFARMR